MSLCNIKHGVMLNNIYKCVPFINLIESTIAAAGNQKRM